MTTPSIAQKRLLAAGAIKSAEAWGTAEELTAGSGLLINTDGGLMRNQPYNPANEADTPMTKEGDLGLIDPVDFNPEFFMRYDSGALGVLLAQLFATAGSPSDLGNGVYSHTFQWADENKGEFCTFAIERVSKIFEVQSAKVMSFDISVDTGFLKGVLGLRGNSLINTSTTNEATEMDALTYADRGNRIKFSQVNIKMNDQSDGNVTGETALEVSDFTVHYERPHDSANKAGSEFIIEPEENERPNINITLNFPRMNAVNNLYFADFIAETEKKMEIKCVGAIAGTGGSIPFSFNMKFPRLRIIPPVDYPFDEIVPATIMLQAEEAASNPTGMDYARPYAFLSNERSTNYLA